MRETRAARVAVEAGMLVVRIRGGVQQTLEDAHDNIAACRQESGRARPGLLLDLTKAAPLSPPVRHYYTGRVVEDVCSSLAVLVESNPLGRIMGNVYLHVARNGVPARIFDDERKARAWLAKRSAAWPGGEALAARTK
jgi:hypothetical protein